MGCFSVLARAWFVGLILLFLCLGKGCGGSGKVAPPPSQPGSEWKLWLVILVIIPAIIALTVFVYRMLMHVVDFLFDLLKIAIDKMMGEDEAPEAPEAPVKRLSDKS